MAVLAVVLYHFAPGIAPGGFLGVDLFFVLSGFLITSLLVSEWRATTRIRLAAFWLRRARRLLPALFLVLAAVALYELLFASHAEAHQVGSDGLWSLVYMANWHFIASGQSYIQQFLSTAPSPLRHFWSLAIEEQFYLVWPLVVTGIGLLATRRSRDAAHRFRRFRAGLIAFCVVAGVASFLRMLTLYHPGDDPSRVYYGTDTRVFVILAGAVIGILSVGAPTVPRRARGLVIVAGILAGCGLTALVLRITTASSFLYEGGYGLIVLMLVAVLLAAAQPGRNLLARLFEWRPLVGLGLISYGVYLWHWPIGLWVTEARTHLSGPALFLLRCALTLVAALASYFLVEMPIRRGGLRALGRVASKALPLAAIAAVAALFVVPVAAFSALPAPPPAVKITTGSPAVTAEYANAPRCDGGPTPTPIDPSHTLVVQLEGNSIAGEIRPCLTQILQARNATLEGVNPPGFLLCKVIPAIQQQVEDPATRPDAAILFAFVAYDPRCGAPWHWPVDKLISIWKKAGTHVYLVPSVPFLPGTAQADQLAPGPLLESAYYRKLAEKDPKHITYLDAGKFIRDPNGEYVWKMPCLPGGEPGCAANGTVGVRWVDGFHFCTDPAYAAQGCAGTEFQAGERRAAASVASGLLPSLQSLFPG
jgi:peptidoglycan/LPS O-acetylase OafA/YrhL